MPSPSIELLLATQTRGRGGIQLVLEQALPGVRCIFAMDAVDATAIARERKPSLCVLDSAVPAFQAPQVLQQLHRAAPGMRVVLVSQHSGEANVAAALRHGAQAYLLKDNALDELPAALRAVQEGRPYVSRALTDALLPAYLRQLTHGGSRESTRNVGSSAPLTPRQQEVLKLIAQGLSTRAMAQALHLSVKTVETHRADIARRLGITDVAGMTRYAVRMGLVSSES